jgi:hypothetical protein
MWDGNLTVMYMYIFSGGNKYSSVLVNMPKTVKIHHQTITFQPNAHFLALLSSALH